MQYIMTTRGEYRIVMVRYRDHTLFKRKEVESIRPVVRQCIGWLVYETEDYMVVVSDVRWENGIVPDRSSSGLVLMKSEVVEVVELDG